MGTVATDAQLRTGKSKYSSLSPVHDFTSTAVETLGAVRESALDFFKRHDD